MLQKYDFFSIYTIITNSFAKEISLFFALAKSGKEKKLHDRLIDTKKVSNIIQHPFIIKTFNKLRYREAASA